MSAASQTGAAGIGMYFLLQKSAIKRKYNSLVCSWFNRYFIDKAENLDLRPEIACHIISNTSKLLLNER